MYMQAPLHACMHACLCDALLWFSSILFYSIYSQLLEALDNKICVGRLMFVCGGCVCMLLVFYFS